MADNSDEEHLNKPANIQSINPSKEIVSTKDISPITPDKETINMEVHKHPHHVAHKKKWTEYVT